MTGKAIFLITALALLPGCALRSMEQDGLRVADGLSDRYPADADRLARDAAEELARRYAPAQTSLRLLAVAGQFGQSLELGLRTKGFAVATGQDAPGVRVGTVTDVIQGELAPSGYVEVSTSDGQRFSLMRRLKGDSLPAPLVPTSGPVVEAPFAMPEPTPTVQATPLAENFAPAAGPVLAPESQGLTPEKEAATQPINRTILLPKAVLTVLPYNWRYTIPDEARRQVKVAAPGNVPWRDAIRYMAAQSGCEARFDDAAHRVTLATVGPIPELPKPTPAIPPTPKAPVSALHPALLPESSGPSSITQPPASPVVAAALQEAGQAKPVEPVAPLVAPVESFVPETTPVAVTEVTSALPEESWTLEPGSLYAQLGRWADQAGYQFVWKADNDLTMESTVVFNGSITDAVKQLFSGLTKAGHGLRAIFYSNNVLEVRGE